MKKFVWLSFDLGVQGDYEGMYDFLDQHQAKECGDSLACFWYETTGDLVDTMTIEIHKGRRKSNEAPGTLSYRRRGCSGVADTAEILRQAQDDRRSAARPTGGELVDVPFLLPYS